MRAAIFHEPRNITAGDRPDAALREPTDAVVRVAVAGSMVGFVGVPHGVEVPIGEMWWRTVGLRGGATPVRVYLPELLDDVLAERINPGRVLDYETDLEDIAGAYTAMDERRAIKPLVRVGTA